MGNRNLEERTVLMPLNSFSKMDWRLEMNQGGGLEKNLHTVPKPGISGELLVSTYVQNQMTPRENELSPEAVGKFRPMRTH